MGNNATKTKNRDLVKIRALKFYPEKQPEASERPASEAAERFLSLAEQLLVGEHIALTFSADKDWNVFASVPDGTELTGEDLKWIFDGTAEPLAETHLIGWSGELVGTLLPVTLCKFIRPERHFDSLEALAVQMQRDIRTRMHLLPAEGEPGEP